jgi:hypothetical protein
MIESCSKKRMLTLIALLLGCSLIILLFEEYVEDNEYEMARMYRQSNSKPDDLSKISSNAATTSAPKPVKHLKKVSEKCEGSEAVSLVKNCQPCSSFEMNALNTEHCLDTGYFDEWKCDNTNESIYLPCISKSKVLTKFYSFALAWPIAAVVFGTFVQWRKSMIEQKLYTRIQNTAG